MRKSTMKSLPVVAATAFFLNGLTATAAILQAPGGGTVRALVIGVNSYPRLGPGAQLHGADADALDIAAALAKDGVKAQLLSDSQATRVRIVEAMDGLVKDSKRGDLVFISYAGHGMQTPEYSRWKGLSRNGVSEQIALSNFSFSGPGVAEVIVKIEMRAWLSRLDAKGVDTVVVMDSCFGGGMRGVDPRSGELLVREVKGSADAAEREKFTGIQMTDKELRADVATMPHVTFLGGATANSVVPEMPGLDPSVPRGALSYFVARALEGSASVGNVVTRKSLFEYVLQKVPEAANQRQFVDIQPASEEADVIEKPVMRFGSENTPTPEPASTASLSPSSDAVRLAVVDGDADAWATIEKGTAPLIAAPETSGADLVWDVGKHEALASGDLVMQLVDRSMIGFVADRTWAIRRLRALSPHVLSIGLASHGKLLIPGDEAKAQIPADETRAKTDDLRGQHLTAFNIAADATIQMLYPAAPGQKGQCPDPSGDRWSCGLEVMQPFGADTIVALATAQEPSAFIAWLKAHHDKRDAALIPAELGRVFANDPSARLGFAGVFTNSTKEIEKERP
ncbi:MAG: caspase family protein [Roseiarcus sp.]